jgi:hypothetical protein
MGWYVLSLVPEEEALPNNTPAQLDPHISWLLDKRISPPANVASGSQGDVLTSVVRGAVAAAVAVRMHVPLKVMLQLQLHAGARPCPLKPLRATVMLLGLPLLQPSSHQVGQMVLQELRSTILSLGGMLLHLSCGHLGTVGVAAFGISSPSVNVPGSSITKGEMDAVKGWAHVRASYTSDGDACRAAQVSSQRL